MKIDEQCRNAEPYHAGREKNEGTNTAGEKGRHSRDHGLLVVQKIAGG